jgi:hypothetical protein
MDHKQKSALAVAVAAGLGGMAATDVAQAATFAATLTSVLTYSNNGTAGSPGNITSSTATWTYDDTTNLVTQTGGLFQVRLTTAPTSTLYRQSITGLVFGNGGAASASTFVCTEGNFGAGVGASICGNYTFGANFLNQSTTTWGPGTAASRTIGGDDAAAGAQQTIASLNGFNTITYAGTTLQISNRTCTSICTTTTGGFNNGQLWNFTVVPVPAAVWLFGSALGLLGVARRRSVA